MQFDFINELELQEFANQLKQVRADELAARGLSNVDLADALRDGVNAGRISQRQMKDFLDPDLSFSATEITALNLKKGLAPIKNLLGEVVGFDHSNFNPEKDIARGNQTLFKNPRYASARRNRLALLEDAQSITADYQPPEFDSEGNIIRGERGIRILDQDGNLLRNGTTVNSTDFQTLEIDGETVYMMKNDSMITQELVDIDNQRQTEAEELLEGVAKNAKRGDSGEIAVDSSWINTIEHEHGATSVQTYSKNGTRLYTYPDASGRQFDAMYSAHERGGSVGRAWWDEIGDTPLKHIFQYN